MPDSPFKPDNTEWSIPRSTEDTNIILLKYARNKLIPKLEKCYGQRSPRYYLKKIVFGGEHPYTEYPGSRGDFHISLTPCCSRRPVSYRAVFQLAHECLHSLKPVRLGAATVLEEGLAAESSLMPNKRVFEKWDIGYDYGKAYIAVKKLRRLIDLDDHIREYREGNPNIGISDITCENIRQALMPKFHNKFDDLIRDVPLFSSFEYWRKCL